MIARPAAAPLTTWRPGGSLLPRQSSPIGPIAAKSVSRRGGVKSEIRRTRSALDAAPEANTIRRPG